MQIVAGIVLSWVPNPSKAGNELFHRAASALDRTPKLQPCPLHRNACLQAPAPYAIALGELQGGLAASFTSRHSPFFASVRDVTADPPDLRSYNRQLELVVYDLRTA